MKNNIQLLTVYTSRAIIHQNRPFSAVLMIKKAALSAAFRFNLN
ncbi:hypothetical protein PROVRUST_07582 [Providencia rustigianii DSM 4541]|uniref:Uncharacterized protein n=1 Tax=Providencia rustigianii DSM 4541 TaxID=500637 RepID=D1P5S3_9GAMM|nr:hypothetical protein PROVRUST_07582 [Providencia rustigianii DSM 4541]